MDILDLDLLTPGSVWHNTKNQKVSRVICITNTALPQKLQNDYPQQVVYLDESGNFLSLPVESFVSKRTFFNVDPALELAASNLATFFNDGASNEDVEKLLNGTLSNDSDLLIVDGDDEDSAGNSQALLDTLETDAQEGGSGFNSTEEELEADERGGDDTIVWAVQYVPEDDSLSTAISPTLLQSLTLSYDQTPMMESNRLMHSIVIAADPRYTRDELISCFIAAPGTAAFVLRVEGHEGIIDWDTFVDVYPVVVDMEPAFKVVLLNSINSDDADLELDEGNFLGTPSPVVSATDVAPINTVGVVTPSIVSVPTTNVNPTVAVATETIAPAVVAQPAVVTLAVNSGVAVAG